MPVTRRGALRGALFYVGTAAALPIVAPFFLPLYAITLGLGIIFLPFMAVQDAMRAPLLFWPVILAIFVYVALCVVVMRTRMTPLRAFIAGVIVCFASYTVFISTAEIAFRAKLEDIRTSGDFQCVQQREILAKQIWRFNPPLHPNDGGAIGQPHATAARDGRDYIWSFGQNRFVTYTGQDLYFGC